MITFEPLSPVDDLQEFIQSTFSLSLPLQGGWGYDSDNATVIASQDTMPKIQLQHTFAMIRAHLEMQLSLPKSERFGSINVNEVTREIRSVNNHAYELVTYEIKAMKESEYATFIEEYKTGYEKESFDMEDHFRRRKEATLTRTEVIWFKSLIDDCFNK